MIPLYFTTDQNNEMYAWMSVVLLPFMEGKRFHKIWNQIKHELAQKKKVDLNIHIINQFGKGTI